MPNSNTIVSAAIYPAIGIARVGNAPRGYFFGPEIPGPHPMDEDDFRDPEGRIKRQAQRFRVYGLDADGNIVCELTAEHAKIEWQVEIANKKAAWYQFSQALDIPASQGDPRQGVNPQIDPLRNLSVSDRGQLAITPRARRISGCSSNADGEDGRYAFDDGRFFGTPVYLGELRTDSQGRLIFLGGRGHTAPAAGHEDAPLPGFGNNPWWHDDTSDGPVTARVQLGGEQIPVTGAWVLTAPPNYAPGIPAAVTGYDLVRDTAIRFDPGLNPAKPSFADDIFPLLRHFPLNEWVNAGFARDFGWGSPQDFRQPALVERLNDPSAAAKPLRESVFNRFRDAGYPFLQTNAWPPFYGDAVTLKSTTTDPREWMAVTPSQYAWLTAWAAGDFIPDGLPAPQDCSGQSSAAEQADGLSYAALNETLGEPFHPGCEFTWPLRHTMLFAAPFRIKYRANSPLDYGPSLSPESALAIGGPLDGSGPGDLTRWMACPWQTDTSSCLSAYSQYSGEYLPTFWPARVPNDVMTAEQYQVLSDPASSERQRRHAFDPQNRPKWLRGIVYDDNIPAQFIQDWNPRQVFTEHWWQVGILVRRPLLTGDAAYPDLVWVESGRSYQTPAAPAAGFTLKAYPQWHDDLRGRR